MEQNKFNLVQANFAYWKPHVPPALMNEFLQLAADIHEQVEKVDGFVWRYSSSEFIDHEVIRIFGNERALFNMTIWDNLEAMKAFSFSGVHLTAMKKRKDWLDGETSGGAVLWWEEKNKIPTVAEAKAKLDLLGREGPSPQAFTIGQFYESPKLILDN